MSDLILNDYELAVNLILLCREVGGAAEVLNEIK